MAIFLVLIIGFLILGVFMSMGKGSFLIAGFNTMPKKEQDRYDKAALTKFMGRMMFALAFAMVFWLLSVTMKLDYLLFIGIGLFIAIILFMLIYMNTGNRFKLEDQLQKHAATQPADQKYLTASRVTTWIGAAVTAGTIVLVIVLMMGAMKETQILLQQDQVIFKGQYGIALNLNEITDIQMIDNLPEVGSKVNGAGIGEILKGDFKVEGFGTCRLFIHSSDPPFIRISYSGKTIFLNFKDPGKTKSVYEKLRSSVK